MAALIERLLTEHHYLDVTSANVDDALAAHDQLLLFFTNDPARFPESLDVAVVLPELHKAFDGQFAIGVVSRDSESELKARFPFNQWPALVFVRRGAMIDVLSRIRDWADYGEWLKNLLAAPEPDARRIANVTL